VAPDTEVSAVFDIAVDKVSSASLNSIVIEDESGNKVGGVAATLSGTKLTISHDAFMYNIIKGYPDGSFKPDNNITRAEFAVVLAKALGWAAKPGRHDFADAAEIPDWAEGYISAAVEKGVISGYEDNTFRANRPITRSEIAVIIVRALGLGDNIPESGTLSFDDAAEIPDWAVGYIAAAVNQGIIKGKPGNIFAPDDNATRAEAAALVSRMLTKL